MNSHGLTRENLVATLPPALQKDPSAVALAEAMADLLAQRPEEIEQLRIYPVIDRLDERLLDILAYDFKRMSRSQKKLHFFRISRCRRISGAAIVLDVIIVPPPICQVNDMFVTRAKPL